MKKGNNIFLWNWSKEMKKVVKLMKNSVFLFINIFVCFRLIFKSRNPKKIVIGAWDGYRYADNPRILFEFLSDNSEFEITWATKSDKIYNLLKKNGKNVVKMGTLESFRVHMEAYYHIVCTDYPDISGEFSWGAVKINLWHGMPIKHVSKWAQKGNKQRTIIHGTRIYAKLKKISIFNAGGWNNCFYISPGALCDKQCLEDFRIDSKWIIHTNYPRNIICHSELPEENAVREKMRQFNSSIIYLPTFRENSNELLLDPIENQEIKEFIEKNNVLWIDKKHFVSAPESRQGDSRNVLHLDGAFDICAILEQADIVITDYSSVFFDALYHLKRVILYMPDYEYYKICDRGFLIDPAEFRGCYISYDIEELSARLLDSLMPFSDEKMREVEHERKKYWSFPEEGMEEIWNKLRQKG